MSVAQVNHYLLAALIQKGMVADWTDLRCNAAARVAARAVARLERWGRE